MGRTDWSIMIVSIEDLDILSKVSGGGKTQTMAQPT